MPQIFLKSLTAWEALPALPPTPKKNKRPWVFRTETNKSTNLLIAWVLSALAMAETSSKYWPIKLSLIKIYTFTNLPDAADLYKASMTFKTSTLSAPEDKTGFL